MSWPFAYALAVAADLTADTLYYLLGRSARHQRAGRLLHRLGLTRERLAAMEASFRRNEARALVGAKVTDVAAVPIFIAAGLSKVGYWRFLAWNTLLALPKSGLLLVSRRLSIRRPGNPGQEWEDNDEDPER
jgi:membrane protein DedA with SNARE-associated domain